MDSDFVGTERYAIEGRLGEGGMGVVYRAYDRERRAPVALKTLTRIDATSIYRLKQEFRSLADVVHPNLVALYDLVSTGTEWFFTMELVEGVAFLEWVRKSAPPRELPRDTRENTAFVTLPSADLTRSSPTLVEAGRSDGGRIDAARVRDALRQLAEGVHAIHAAGKLHRDLKPTNVLVTTSGRVKILDFGLVADHEAPLDERSIDGDLLVVGTPAYMAPEQAAGERASGASDWYAVGVMLYVTLTGRLPFDGAVRDVMALKQHADPVPPARLSPAVPEDLDALCRALLARDPALRPGFGDVAARLRLGAASPVSVSVELPASERASKERSATPLFGRSRELDELVQALRDSRAGAPVCCFLAGPAGVGKTALLDRFMEHLARSTDSMLVSGRSYPRESVPYKAFDAVVDALSRQLRRLGGSGTDALLPRNTPALVRLFPVLERVEAISRARRCARFEIDDLESRPRAFAAFKELLARIADRQPLVIRVDDLQWGDRDSADLLLSLLSPPDAPALLFLGAYRTDLGSPGPMLDRLHSSGSPLAGSRRELALGPLDLESSLSLALELIGRYDDAAWSAAKTIAREARGNPLLVEELSRHFAELDVDPDSIALQAGAGSSLEHVLAGRLTALSSSQRSLLEVLAIAGGPLHEEVLARTARADDARMDLDALAKLRLVRATRHRDAPAVELAHDPFQGVLLSRLDEPAVRRLHSALAAELVASGAAEPEALALHFHAAGEHALGAEYALRAADKAAQALAFDRAAHFFELALELTPEDADRWRLLSRLAEALLGAGRFDEAVEQLSAAAKLAPTLEGIRLAKRMAEITLRHRGDLSHLGPQGAVGLFDEIPREEVQQLISRFRIVAGRMGDVLIAHGARAEAFYVVVSGQVDLHTPGRPGSARLGEGAVLAEIPFLRHASFVADVTAASDEVRLLAVDQSSLDSLVDSHPRLALKLVMNVARILCEKATGVRRRALEAGPLV